GAAGSFRSSTSASTVAPCSVRSRSANASSRSRRRATSTKSKFRSAKTLARAEPMPAEAPVIKAVRRAVMAGTVSASGPPEQAFPGGQPRGPPGAGGVRGCERGWATPGRRAPMTRRAASASSGERPGSLEQTDALEAALQAAAQRDLHLDLRAGGGVLEGQAVGVQRQPLEPVFAAKPSVVLALAVANVANQRAGDVLHVAPELVEPARDWHELDQRVALERAQPPVAGDRRDLGLPGSLRDR